MLGINYQRIESNSVGHKTDFEMRSLDFEGVPVGEGYDDSIVDEMLTHLIEARPFTNVQHKALMDVFLDYCALGGMPDVVRSYIDRNIRGIASNPATIGAGLSRKTFKKYAEGLDKGRILNVFNHIPAQLAKENKKFK